MTDARVDVVIVGGGQGGLGVAYYLKAAGIDAVVLEQEHVGETWRSQRWDSFVLNTPNWMNGLPGAPYDGPERFGFMSGSELVSSFENYVNRFDLQVRSGVKVTRVTASPGSARFDVEATGRDGGGVLIEADSVVIASGILQTPRVPPISSKLSDQIVQLTAGSYRSAAALPEGAVVVVGGGQSGGQIVEDLLGAGRTVYFSISKAPRLPRHYRGRDFMDWWVDMGFWDVDIDEVDDPAVLGATNPLVSGVGPLGHSISYQQLARDGAHLLGRLQDTGDGKLITDDKVLEYIQHADQFSQALKTKIDARIEENGLEAPEPDLDAADAALDGGETIDFATELDLDQAGVKTVIWSTGFTADFSWIDLPVIDDHGRPVHHKGVSQVPGIYFVGFPWLSKRKSGVIYGVDEDAKRIAHNIAAQSA
jgi:putative flavoprotein involved in K+ transport